MIDKNLKKTLKEIAEIINPKPMERLSSHLNSLFIQITRLTKSREMWKERYTKLKSEFDTITHRNKSKEVKK